ncbi:RNA polymerase sigma factor [Marinihelvus fidelis]|uniref:RNA polymerase sigma factor n=1 Tax=Marinihelvus fidelis TaxID=2613842 RepID=UPI0017855409|nr:sigma-70 family RNA polymerase sigma factor [Marinihelvus fidelis]
MRGDPAAERELIEQHERPIKLLLLQRTQDAQLASDIAQDTFIIALRKLREGDLHTPDALCGFLRQVALNRLLEHFRKEKRYLRQDDGIIELQTPHKDRKAERIDQHRARRMLEGVMAQLTQPRDREILHRFYLLEEDKADICTDLELTAAHFDRVLYRARQRMRELLCENLELRALLFGGLFDG